MLVYSRNKRNGQLTIAAERFLHSVNGFVNAKGLNSQSSPIHSFIHPSTHSYTSNTRLDLKVKDHGDKVTQLITATRIATRSCWTQKRAYYSPGRPVESRSGARENIIAGPYHSPILYRSRRRRRREGGNVGRGVPSPSDLGFWGAS